MEAIMSRGFKIRTVTVRSGSYSYKTHKLTGRLNGVRIRRNFQNLNEALGEKNRLEVEAANIAGRIRAVHTRLTNEEVAAAEQALTRLAGRPLAFAIDWFLANYKPPIADVTLEDAKAAFLADRSRHVRAVALRDYRGTLKRFCAAFPGRMVHSITTAEVERFLLALNVGKKRWNNLRGDLSAFFSFSAKPPREWARSNPVTPISTFKITRGIPEILSVDTARNLMAYVEGYAGGPRSKLPKGVLVPYFALTLFAGLRPSVPDGEVCKLARHPNRLRLLDLGLGVIRITPDIAKTNDVRQVTIQPNLSAWLQAYPLERFPIVPKNARRMIQHVRARFALGDDVLRHTYISAYVAKYRSLGDAALQAGNSEAMIRRHYFNVISEADAAAFWSIVPRA
jgi:site-specific recombinase XerC